MEGWGSGKGGTITPPVGSQCYVPVECNTDKHISPNTQVYDQASLQTTMESIDTKHIDTYRMR